MGLLTSSRSTNGEPLKIYAGPEKKLFLVDEDLLFGAIDDEDTLLRLGYNITMDQELFLENRDSRAIEMFVHWLHHGDLAEDTDDLDEPKDGTMDEASAIHEKDTFLNDEHVSDEDAEYKDGGKEDGDSDEETEDNDEEGRVSNDGNDSDVDGNDVNAGAGDEKEKDYPGNYALKNRTSGNWGELPLCYLYYLAENWGLPLL